MKNKLIQTLIIFCLLAINAKALSKSDTARVKEWIQQGKKMRKSGDFDSSLIFLEKAKDLAHQLGVVSDKGESFYQLGLTYRDMGNFKLALNNIDSSLVIAEKTSNKKSIAANYNGKGLIMRKQGLYNQALKCFFYSLKIREEIKDSMGMAGSLTNIGSVYDEQHNFDKAIEKHYQAIAIRKAIRDEEGLAPCYGNLAGVYLEQSNYKEALKFQLMALDIEKKFQVKQDIASSISNIGLIYSSQSDFDNALKYQLEALKLKREMGNKSSIVASLINIGQTYLSTNKLKPSEYHLFEAYNLATQINDLDGKKEAAKYLSELYKKENIPSKELYYFKEYISVRDSLMNVENIKETERIALNYEFDKKELAQRVLSEKKEAIALEKLRNKELEVSRSKIIVFSLIVLIVVIAIILLLLIKQNKYKALQNSMQLEQQLLRSQMNPHFIFNSINSIQRYILQNDQQEAYDYLAKFSKLIRLVLNISQEKTLSLKQELDMIKLYVELEQLRFDSKFEFKTTKTDNINEDDLNVPCLLIQPYVENAIWHGLMNLDKNKKGKLSIDLVLQGELLKITIEDNGVGRELAKSYKAENGEKSMGMKLTEQRLQMINKLQDYENAKVLISDLHDEAGEANGTRVEILLPVI